MVGRPKLNKELQVSNEYYLNNPLVHRDRRLVLRPSPWVNQID